MVFIIFSQNDLPIVGGPSVGIVQIETNGTPVVYIEHQLIYLGWAEMYTMYTEMYYIK